MNAPVDVTNIRIETERLILRPWREEDLQDFYEYASVPGVGEMAGWPHHETVETSRLVLDLFIREKKTFAVVLKENGKVIGSLGLEEADRANPEMENKRGREVGYVLSKAYWGQGLMPEAVEAVINYCFSALAYDFLTCGHAAWNMQSSRVIEKCGFRFMKVVPFHTQMGTEESLRLYVINNPNK